MIEPHTLSEEERFVSATMTDPEPVQMQSATEEPVWLDLASSQSSREAIQEVGLFAHAQLHVDLLRFHLPWATGSVEEIHCPSFVERNPTSQVRPDVVYSIEPQSPENEDHFFTFFDECWRHFRSGRRMARIVAALQSHRASQDPTQRPSIPAESLPRLSQEWRKINSLKRHRVVCIFTGPDERRVPLEEDLVPVEESIKPPEVQPVRVRTLWNLVGDWRVHMGINKPTGGR